MSIKPVAWMWRCPKYCAEQGWHVCKSRPADADAHTESYEDFPLYAIPDTHRVVPVKPAPEMINAALPHAMRESDEDKYRAIGEIICIWDEMLAAHTAMASQGGE